MPARAMPYNIGVSLAESVDRSRPGQKAERSRAKRHENTASPATRRKNEARPCSTGTAATARIHWTNALDELEGGA